MAWWVRGRGSDLDMMVFYRGWFWIYYEVNGDSTFLALYWYHLIENRVIYKTLLRVKQMKTGCDDKIFTMNENTEWTVHYWKIQNEPYTIEKYRMNRTLLKNTEWTVHYWTIQNGPYTIEQYRMDRTLEKYRMNRTLLKNTEWTVHYWTIQNEPYTIEK